MTIKLTIADLSNRIGISPAEVKRLLKEHGVEVTSEDQTLTADQIKVIREGMKSSRSKVSINKTTKPSTTSSKGKITINRAATSKDTPKTIEVKAAPVVKKGQKLKTSASPASSPATTKSKVEKPEPQETLPPEQPITQAHQPLKKEAPVATSNQISIGEEATLNELSKKTGLSEQVLTQAFFDQGYMLKKNEPIDFDTATLLLETIGVSVKKEETKAKKTSKKLKVATGKESTRAPIVTIMGHVDHGKTSLIDYLRKTKVVQKEAGGITQHIAAYQVPTSKGLITFLDTPGHEAFSSMRSRGAKLTDIIVLIIACNDGVKPQTIESIQHAKASNTPIIVALTKMDVAEKGRVDEVVKELSVHNVLAESWGGDTMIMPISSKTGEGIDELLEAISLQAEVMELKAIHDGPAQGCVVESRVDRGRGTVVTMIVQSGTLSIGDVVSAGPGFGKVRTMIDGSGKKVKTVHPSTPVEITGISPAPKAHDDVQAHPDERTARQLAAQNDSDSGKSKAAVTCIDSLFAQHASDKLSLKIILKADTQGSLEALNQIIEDLSTDEVELNVIDSAVGSINSSDANLAASSGAEILGFHINIESSAKKQLEQFSVQVNTFKIIYQMIDHIKLGIHKLRGPEMVEKQLGTGRVKAVFRSSKFGQIAGCDVLEGIIKRGALIRITRKDTEIFNGELSSLKREKENITEARKGTETGLGFKNFSDAEIGDDIVCYELEEKPYE